MKLYHPVLDQTIEVSDRSAHVYRRSGWVDAGAAASEWGGAAEAERDVPETTDAFVSHKAEGDEQEEEFDAQDA